MSEPPREASGEAEVEDATGSGAENPATDGRELVSSLAAAAAGESVTADRLGARLVSEGPGRLVDVLAPGEQPQYLLEGVIADRVREGGARSRRMATPDGSVYTLVTDRAVHLVVQYRDRLDVETVPLTRVRGTAVTEAGDETRFGIETDEERHEVYPSSTPVTETRAVAAYLDEWENEDESDTGDDPVSGLERLAGLYERGLLTDEEFAAAKRDLLQ